MSGHSGGVSSAVEIPPAIPANLTKSSESSAGGPPARAAPTGPAQRSAASLKRRVILADSAMLLVGFVVATVLALYRPAGLYLDDHVKLWVCSLPVLRLRRVARAPLRRSRQRTPGRGVGQHREGGRRQRRRLGVDRLLPQLRGPLAVLGHRAWPSQPRSPSSQSARSREGSSLGCASRADCAARS